MFNLNLTEVRESITVKTDGSVTVDYGFDFADGSFGGLFSNGTASFHRTVKRLT